MKIENIEKICERHWLIETKEKAIAYCDISAEDFLDQLISIINQPERSKREDSLANNPFLREIPECGFSDEMRCSELYGNIERDK